MNLAYENQLLNFSFNLNQLAYLLPTLPASMSLDRWWSWFEIREVCLIQIVPLLVLLFCFSFEKKAVSISARKSVIGKLEWSLKLSESLFITCLDQDNLHVLTLLNGPLIPLRTVRILISICSVFRKSGDFKLKRVNRDRWMDLVMLFQISKESTDP